MSPVQTALKGLVADLHERGRLRVWSLVVTFFGDAVAPRGGRVALAVLQDVMGRLGVEAGALRTALSRLAADQWVMREKAGRNSLYALDGHGRHAFDQATRLDLRPRAAGLGRHPDRRDRPARRRCPGGRPRPRNARLRADRRQRAGYVPRPPSRPTPTARWPACSC